MKVVLAPDSFKGTLSAGEVAEAMARGVQAGVGEAEVDRCPIADGGEGTLAAILSGREGERRRTKVTGPLGDPVEAEWGWIEDGPTAVIEMAAAAGLSLVPKDRRDPTRTTTYGVGELIRAALEAGAKRIIVGVGGSATCDGGAGMAQALGVTFVGGDEPMTGGDLIGLERVDRDGRDERLDDVEIIVASDVTNPLLGDRGAAPVYAPQKGADEAQVRELAEGLAHLASLVEEAGPDEPGAGAAGGLGFGLHAFCGARIESGIDLVLDQVDFDRRVRDADLVLTGEGQMDGQSIEGKACLGVAKAARRHNVPTIALIGSAGEAIERTYEHGLAAYFCICDRPMSMEEALAQTDRLLEVAARNVVRTVREAERLAARG